MEVLRGVVMEIEDAAYPLVENVYVRCPSLNTNTHISSRRAELTWC